MEDILNTVDAVQEDVVDSQAGQVETTVETVNADTANVTNGKQEETKPVQSAEENAKYAEIRRKAEAEAEAKTRDKMISEMYGESHGIHTYAEYQVAIAKQQEEQRLSELLEQNIPEEYAKEMIENRKFREQFEAEQRAKQQQEQQQKDYKEFITAFPDVKAEEIPTEVWQTNANGIPLRYAYAEYALKLTKASEAKEKANADNAKSSMGRATGDGTTGETYFTPDQVKSMSPAEVKKNFTMIEKSMKRW